jgi:hypothetical protein
MATLYYQGHDRRSWLTWAVALGRHGVWPNGAVEVHGPHENANYMFGEADCIDQDGRSCIVCFKTAELTPEQWKSRHTRITGLRVWNKADRSETLRLLSPEGLSASMRECVSRAQEDLRHLLRPPEHERL